MFSSFYEIMYGSKPRRDEKIEDIKRIQLKEIEKRSTELEDIKKSIEELKMLIIQQREQESKKHCNEENPEAHESYPKEEETFTPSKFPCKGKQEEGNTNIKEEAIVNPDFSDQVELETTSVLKK